MDLAEETITFELIRRIQREEQSQQKLTKLPDNFYSNVASYVAQKKRLAETKEDKRMALEVKSIEMLIEDVFNRRERKIINTAINSARTGIPPENMIEEELAFYNGLLDFIKSRRLNILKNIMNETEIKEERIEEKIIEETRKTAAILSSSPALMTSAGISAKDMASLIVFKEDVPSFMGADMRQYGPFKKGDIAKVPDENMHILLERGVVEEFKVSKE